VNFDKFKSIKPRQIAPPENDDGYSEKLLALGKRPKMQKIVPIITTCAAAIVIVTVVGVWALIGRGLRIGDVTDTPVPSTPQQPMQTLEKDASISALQREAFFEVFAKYKINAMPEFTQQSAPTLNDMARYIYHLYPNETSEKIVAADVLNRDAKALFGLEYDVSEDIAFDGSTSEYPFAELIGYKTDGQVVTATAAVYYMWNLVDRNCEAENPTDFAIAKGSVTSGHGNIVDITAIYTVTYLSDDGITPTRFLSLKKCLPPSEEYYEFFK